MFARTSRGFATTSTRKDLPPESPDFVHIPKSLQSQLILPLRVRGTLPVPREVFPERKPEKLQQDFAERATRSPKKAFDPNKATEAEKVKRRMAELRKQSLRQGLEELRARKLKTERQFKARKQARTRERERLIAQAEREDERLTSPSVLSGLLSQRGGRLQDPNAEERHMEKVVEVQARAQVEKEEKIDALHTLYMNARDFIVTEEQLNAEIERVFPEGNNPAFQTPSGQGQNVWYTGLQPSVGDLLKKTATTDTAGGARANDVETNHERARISTQRVKKLAESMTGGDM